MSQVLFPLCADGISFHYCHSNHLLLEERDRSEMGGGNMHKYSLSINITSEFVA